MLNAAGVGMIPPPRPSTIPPTPPVAGGVRRGREDDEMALLKKARMSLLEGVADKTISAESRERMANGYHLLSI